MPTIALALGAGGARGLAHIPVLEALDEMGLEPVAIAGASMGAIIGAGRAAGLSGLAMRDYAIETIGKRGTIANRLWSLGPGSMRDALGGLRIGQFNLERILEAFLPPEIPSEFAELKIPLTVIATDYYGQCEAVLTDGKLHEALAASAAIPALFMPVRLNGRVMIDGGLFNPVPYEHLRAAADIVIGVDVIGGPEGDGTTTPTRMESLFGATQLMMLSAMQLKLQLGRPDIFLRPPVNAFGVLDFLKARQVLEATEGVKDELKRELETAIEARIKAG
ncbi:patatin-like phospholipase family protein [Rhizobium halophytocola]|nr:patatin-like phospholipase family protein [Rhizobium halophytocola]